MHLDHLMPVTTAGNTYNIHGQQKTTFNRPVGLENTTAQLAAFDIDSGTNLGRYGLITQGVDGNGTPILKIDGDWSGQLL